MMTPRAEWAANARRRKTGTNTLWNMVAGVEIWLKSIDEDQEGVEEQQWREVLPPLQTPRTSYIAPASSLAAPARTSLQRYSPTRSRRDITGRHPHPRRSSLTPP